MKKLFLTALVLSFTAPAARAANSDAVWQRIENVNKSVELRMTTVGARMSELASIAMKDVTGSPVVDIEEQMTGKTDKRPIQEGLYSSYTQSAIYVTRHLNGDASQVRLMNHAQPMSAGRKIDMGGVILIRNVVCVGSQGESIAVLSQHDFFASLFKYEYATKTISTADGKVKQAALARYTFSTLEQLN